MVFPERERPGNTAESGSQTPKARSNRIPFYQEFKDAGGKGLGSPALRKMLSEAGHPITDRDARWLAKNLPSMDMPTVSQKFIARRKLEIARRRPKGLEHTCAQTAD